MTLRVFKWLDTTSLQWFQEALLEQGHNLVRQKMRKQELLDVEAKAAGEGQGILDTNGRRDNGGTLATVLRVV